MISLAWNHFDSANSFLHHMTLFLVDMALRSLDICRVSISPVHKVSRAARDILADSTHVLYVPTRYRYQAILEHKYDERLEGLWLMFTSNPMRYTRVVRSWARRRVEGAVMQKLNDLGFNKSGNMTGHEFPQRRRFSSGITLHDGRAIQAADVLVGTVEVAVLDKCVETSYHEVQRQAGQIAQEIVRICGRHLNSGKHHFSHTSRGSRQPLQADG